MSPVIELKSLFHHVKEDEPLSWNKHILPRSGLSSLCALVTFSFSNSFQMHVARSIKSPHDEFIVTLGQLPAGPPPQTIGTRQ